MPLRAFIDGREVLAPTLSEAEWETLRERGARVVLPCCGSEGYLRRSRLGTLHFAHKRGAHCDATGETIEHLKAKADIVLACQRAGYQALTEVAGDGWRADVLAVRGSARIAFEVQWSFLRLEDAVFRQERYAHDGVRGCWFFRNPPPQLLRSDDLGNPWLRAQRDLPLFHLFVNLDYSFSIELGGKLRGLGEIVEGLLGGRIHFCETAQASDEQRLEVVPFAVKCPQCGRSTDVYRIDPTLTARCGRRFKTHALEFRREILAAVRALAREQPHLRFGAPAEQVAENGKKALLFGCAHCGAAIRPDHIERTLYGAPNLLAESERYPISVRFGQPISAHAAHWCFPDDGVFCCEK